MRVLIRRRAGPDQYSTRVSEPLMDPKVVLPPDNNDPRKWHWWSRAQQERSAEGANACQHLESARLHLFTLRRLQVAGKQ